MNESVEKINSAPEAFAAETGAPKGEKKRFHWGANERRALYGAVTAAIPLIGYLLFNLVPLVIAIVTMFVDMEGYDFGSMSYATTLQISAKCFPTRAFISLSG